LVTEEFDRDCILVADDDVLTRNLVSAILSHEGHSVLAAANNREALEISRTFKGEIHLLIANSSDWSRSELAQVIAVERPQVRVILLSASTRVELKEVVRQMHPGAFQHASLPPALSAAVRRALDNSDFGAGLIEL
jgi:DNA-binding NtrC family response regulator